MFRSDVGWKMALALVVPAMATDGHVKVLLETDGVELHGRSCSTNGPRSTVHGGLSNINRKEEDMSEEDVPPVTEVMIGY